MKRKEERTGVRIILTIFGVLIGIGILGVLIYSGVTIWNGLFPGWGQ